MGEYHFLVFIHRFWLLVYNYIFRCTSNSCAFTNRVLLGAFECCRSIENHADFDSSSFPLRDPLFQFFHLSRVPHSFSAMVSSCWSFRMFYSCLLAVISLLWKLHALAVVQVSNRPFANPLILRSREYLLCFWFIFFIHFLGLRVVPTLWAWIVSIAASVPNKCLMQLLPLTRWSHLHVLLILGFLCKYPLSYLSIIFSWLFSALHLVLSLHPPCPPLKRSEMSFSVISMPPRDWTSPTWVLQNGKFHSCVQTWHSQSCIIVIIF